MHHGHRTSTEEHDVTWSRSRGLGDGLLFGLAQELEDGGLPGAVGVDLDVGKPLGTEAGHQVCVLIDGRAADATTPRHPHGRQARARGIGRLGKHLETTGLEGRSQLHHLQWVAQVGAVAAIAGHGLGMAHAGERLGQAHTQHLLEQGADHGLAERHHIGFVDEGHLHVQLGELGLAVGAQVLVAKAAHDLIVAVQAAHHEQLLEELW